MPLPNHRISKEECKRVLKVSNFPHVVGCFDVKHICVVCPTHSVARFFNYKETLFSVVLQGLVDANYKFITVQMGGFGKQSDGDSFLAQSLSVSLMEKE